MASIGPQWSACLAVSRFHPSRAWPHSAASLESPMAAYYSCKKPQDCSCPKVPVIRQPNHNLAGSTLPINDHYERNLSQSNLCADTEPNSKPRRRASPAVRYIQVLSKSKYVVLPKVEYILQAASNPANRSAASYSMMVKPGRVDKVHAGRTYCSTSRIRDSLIYARV